MTETQYLVDILVLLAAAVIAVPIFQRLGLGSVLGYLAAGAIVGPWGFGFIDQNALSATARSRVSGRSVV
jgi:Kef-type K+ transport system membrane component KefB